MKSAFSAICSSVIPITLSSSSKPFQDGSTVSMGETFLSGLAWRPAVGDRFDGAGLGGMMDSAGAGAGADEERCPSRLPRPKR